MKMHLVFAKNLGGDWVRIGAVQHTESMALRDTHRCAIKFIRLPRRWSA